MIYIFKNANNEVTTDNCTDYIPGQVSIYLEDIKIGTYTNITTNLSFIRFIVPSTDLIDLELKEYKMIIRNDSNATIIKTELISVKNDITPQFTELINNKKEKFYE